MAAIRESAVFWTLALLHGSFFYICQSCSPEGWWPTTLVDDVLMAQGVYYGVVRNTYQDQDHDTAYTVELEVYCVLKGPKTPSLVNITGGGYIPGLCTSSEFIVSGVYIVTAYVDQETDPESFRLSVSGGQINATQGNLNEIAKACGLNPVTRPEGSSSSIECPVSVPDCQREPTPRETPLKPIKPIEGVDVDESNSNSNEPDGALKIDAKQENKTNDGSTAIATVATTLATAAAVALAIVGI